MKIYQLREQLITLPDNKRIEIANNYFRQVGSIGHDAIDLIIKLLPLADRSKFISDNLNILDSPYIFSLALTYLPQESQLEFANKHYSYFTLERRCDSAALANILRLIPKKDRFEFANRFKNEIRSDTWLAAVLGTLSQVFRLNFILEFSQCIFFSSTITLQILNILPQNDRLQFFLKTRGNYLASNALDLIPPADAEKFIEANIQKMLLTFEHSKSISNSNNNVKHPIYYSLERAFDTIEVDQTDNQKLQTYTKIAAFFNTRYSLNIKVFNPLQDNRYLYLRTLESESVTTLVKKNTRFEPKISTLITQYSGHHIDPTQCLARGAQLKSLNPCDITWGDLVYLHKNSLGLRGVTDDDMAVTEATKGGYGDAISLANFGRGKNDSISFLPSDNAAITDEKIMDEKFSLEKERLLKSFQEGMKWHIQISLNYGPSVAFELVTRGKDALNPYDFGDTYRLGKCGSRSFNANQVIRTILRADAPEWNVETVYKIVTAEIKSLVAGKPSPNLSNRVVSDKPLVKSLPLSILQRNSTQINRFSIFKNASTAGGAAVGFGLGGIVGAAVGASCGYIASSAVEVLSDNCKKMGNN